jgi:TatA/E family protein of Tat protein translocase
MGMRPTEILLILFVLLLLFGATRLPQLGSSLGSAIKNFKRGFSEEESAGGDKPGQGTLSSATEIKEPTRGKAVSKEG